MDMDEAYQTYESTVPLSLVSERQLVGAEKGQSREMGWDQMMGERC
jgi:hypothetical protein